MSASVFTSLILLHFFMLEDRIFWNVSMLGSLKICHIFHIWKVFNSGASDYLSTERHYFYFNNLPIGFWTQGALRSDSQCLRGLAFEFQSVNWLMNIKWQITVLQPITYGCVKTGCCSTHYRLPLISVIFNQNFPFSSAFLL